MKLEALLEGIEVLHRQNFVNHDIKHLSQDSRDITEGGTLFFAVPGTQVDGHDFIPEVMSQKALVIVCERIPENVSHDVCFIQVKKVASAMGQMASSFYDHPSREMKVIAITGTNGKTSVATYIAQALGSLKQPTLLLSTAGDYFNTESIVTERKAGTSIEIITLHKTLREYLDKGALFCCLEATSIALDQERMSGVEIAFAVFTNLTQDHLDYHGTIGNYAKAKNLLFRTLGEKSVAIANFDDPHAQEILQGSLAKIISYGKNNEAYDYSFTIDEAHLEGVVCKINKHELKVPLIGEFNIYNLTAAFAVLSELNFLDRAMIPALSSIHGVPGRMQIIPHSQNILAVVDYAHSPDALRNVLESLREIPHEKIITVVGCGGDRDRGKRPQMAAISQALSDFVIYTSDNPRTESLAQIFKDMEAGVDPQKDNVQWIEEREEAIRRASEEASSGDIILVAGKGHEDYQIIGTEKRHFDDREMLARYLA